MKLLLLVILTFIAINIHAMDPFRMDRPSFDYVCALLEADCRGIEAPNVVVTRSIDLKSDDGYRIYGLYIQGEPNVYIHPDTKDFGATVLHELVHYINHEAKLGYSRCEGEAKARDLAGHPWGNKEKERYGCTRFPIYKIIW